MPNIWVFHLVIFITLAYIRAPCTVLLLPLERVWRVVESGDPFFELKEGVGGLDRDSIVFIHPACNQDVIAGNSTIGLEIGSWLQEKKKCK